MMCRGNRWPGWAWLAGCCLLLPAAGPAAGAPGCWLAPPLKQRAAAAAAFAVALGSLFCLAAAAAAGAVRDAGHSPLAQLALRSAALVPPL
jgi:hypothetical protein